MRWQKKLGKKEMAHVKEWCDGTLRGIKEARKFQKEQKMQNPQDSEPCWDCREIAIKLGLEE